jgi:hypothetical protein
MKKRKPTPEERAAWKARAEARVRELRQLVERGRAELDARGRGSGDAKAS